MTDPATGLLACGRRRVVLVCPASARKGADGAIEMDSEQQMPAVRRWRVECLGGPWWDGEPCVRFVDLLETQSLFDLHDGIQAAIAFDGEYPFCFFRAPGPEGPREMIPGTLGPTPLREEVINCVGTGYRNSPSA